MIALLTFAGLLLFATLVALFALLATWVELKSDEPTDQDEGGRPWRD